MDSVEVKDEQEIEIDLKALFLKIKSLWYVVIIGLLIGALIAIIYTAFLKTPQYESSSMVYLRSASKSVSLQDLQLGSELTNDYEIIFKSRPNMEKVIKKLDLDMDVKELTNMITIANPADTRILQVSVVSNDPNTSKNIANEVVTYGMNNIREIDSQEPYLVEKAIANEEKIGPSILKMGAIGGAVGLMLALGAIFIRFILSDQIQSVEDVERVLGLPVLTVVVEDKALNYAKKKSNNEKRRWK